MTIQVIDVYNCTWLNVVRQGQDKAEIVAIFATNNPVFVTHTGQNALKHIVFQAFYHSRELYFNIHGGTLPQRALKQLGRACI